MNQHRNFVFGVAKKLARKRNRAKNCLSTITRSFGRIEGGFDGSLLGKAYLLDTAFFEIMILQRDFYERDTITVAKELLGKILMHESVEGTTEGKIVETEAYRGPEDQAAHSSGGRRTPRNEVMYGEKGHAYVYLIYGMYFCVNITAGNMLGKPEAILIRALEPVAGEKIMAIRRGVIGREIRNLAGGPGKLCIAMGITKAQNKLDITKPPLYIKNAPPVKSEEIVETTRVGVDYAGEWKNSPWRFYIKGNKYVSKK
jgi:DNA-3-methyladenine glycosylase